jgi:cysteine desulfurase
MTDPFHRPLYFDHHATTPLDPRVLEKMLPYFCEDFGNAESAQHAYGWKAKMAVEQARGQVAALLNAEKSEILFTSGATESIHLAILGFMELQSAGSHLITSNTEHKVTLEVCARAAKLGYEVTVLPADSFGRVSALQVAQALRSNTALVSLMHGNNEIGTLNPCAEIGALLAEHSICFHVDAAQTVGREPIDVRALQIGMLSLSAHKLYGPKGVGALFVRKQPKVHIAPYLTGGGQERGLRGGTHNVPSIVGLGAACEYAQAEMATERERLLSLRDQMIQGLTRNKAVALNGSPVERLCNNVNVTVSGIDESALALALTGFAYSSGSACSATGFSHVLKAIGRLPTDSQSTTLRFGLGRSNTAEQVASLIAAMDRVLRPPVERSGVKTGTCVSDENAAPFPVPGT